MSNVSEFTDSVYKPDEVPDLAYLRSSGNKENFDLKNFGKAIEDISDMSEETVIFLDGTKRLIKLHDFYTKFDTVVQDSIRSLKDPSLTSSQLVRLGEYIDSRKEISKALLDNKIIHKLDAESLRTDLEEEVVGVDPHKLFSKGNVSTEDVIFGSHNSAYVKAPRNSDNRELPQGSRYEIRNNSDLEKFCKTVEYLMQEYGHLDPEKLPHVEFMEHLYIELRNRNIEFSDFYPSLEESLSKYYDVERFDSLMEEHDNLEETLLNRLSKKELIDGMIPSNLKDTYDRYKSISDEFMDMLEKAFYDALGEGDPSLKIFGKVFNKTYPKEQFDLDHYISLRNSVDRFFSPNGDYLVNVIQMYSLSSLTTVPLPENRPLLIDKVGNGISFLFRMEEYYLAAITKMSDGKNLSTLEDTELSSNLKDLLRVYQSVQGATDFLLGILSEELVN